MLSSFQNPDRLGVDQRGRGAQYPMPLLPHPHLIHRPIVIRMTSSSLSHPRHRKLHVGLPTPRPLSSVHHFLQNRKDSPGPSPTSCKSFDELTPIKTDVTSSIYNKRETRQTVDFRPTQKHRMLSNFLRSTRKSFHPKVHKLATVKFSSVKSVLFWVEISGLMVDGTTGDARRFQIIKKIIKTRSLSDLMIRSHVQSNRIMSLSCENEIR